MDDGGDESGPEAATEHENVVPGSLWAMPAAEPDTSASEEQPAASGAEEAGDFSEDRSLKSALAPQEQPVQAPTSGAADLIEDRSLKSALAPRDD